MLGFIPKYIITFLYFMETLEVIPELSLYFCKYDRDVLSVTSRPWIQITRRET